MICLRNSFLVVYQYLFSLFCSLYIFATRTFFQNIFPSFLTCQQLFESIYQLNQQIFADLAFDESFHIIKYNIQIDKIIN